MTIRSPMQEAPSHVAWGSLRCSDRSLAECQQWATRKQVLDARAQGYRTLRTLNEDVAVVAGQPAHALRATLFRVMALGTRVIVINAQSHDLARSVVNDGFLESAKVTDAPLPLQQPVILHRSNAVAVLDLGLPAGLLARVRLLLCSSSLVTALLRQVRLGLDVSHSFNGHACLAPALFAVRPVTRTEHDPRFECVPAITLSAVSALPSLFCHQPALTKWDALCAPLPELALKLCSCFRHTVIIGNPVSLVKS